MFRILCNLLPYLILLALVFAVPNLFFLWIAIAFLIAPRADGVNPIMIPRTHSEWTIQTFYPRSLNLGGKGATTGKKGLVAGLMALLLILLFILVPFMYIAVGMFILWLAMFIYFKRRS